MVNERKMTGFASKAIVALLSLMMVTLVSPLTTYANRRDDLLGLWIAYGPVGNGWGDSGIRWDFWSDGTWVRINEDNQGTRVYGTWELDGSNILTIRAGNFGWENDTRLHTIRWENANRVYITLSGTVDPALVLVPHYSRPHADVPHTHTPGDWITTREATCAVAGHRERRCIVCDDIVTSEPIPNLGHVLSGQWVVRREPTCMEAGERIQYCTRCNVVATTESIPTLPHTLHGEWVAITQPTCTAQGEEIRYCEVCDGAGETRSIPMLPHQPSGTWVIYEEPLCNTLGRQVQYCLVCNGIAMDEVIPAITGLNHVFAFERVRGNIFIPPIVNTRTCEVCVYYGGTIRSFAFVWLSPLIVAVAVACGVWAVKAKKKAVMETKRQKKFVCPYCFETELVQKVDFRCASPKCASENDIELSRYEGVPIKAKRTFPAPPSINYDTPEYANCPDCYYETSNILCPHCHNSLPESTLSGEDMIISIVGSRDVGKSHFVGVIINELRERIAGRFESVLEGFGDTPERYEASFGRNLYQNLTKLDLTQSSTVNVNNGAYKPYIYTLSVDKKNKIKNYTLVFFDTAGEDLNEYETMNAVSRYICKSAGIIFLLDPMQIWHVRNKLDDDTIKRASSVAINQATRPDDIMTRVSRLIRADTKMKATEKINIPVAAVFSKFDAIEPLVPPGATVLEASPHCSEGAFVMSDWHNVNTEVESLLKEWEATTFVQQLKVNYAKYSFFTASALGLENNPRSDSRINRPNPHRIEDALLWILKENRVIDSTK